MVRCCVHYFASSISWCGILAILCVPAKYSHAVCGLHIVAGTVYVIGSLDFELVQVYSLFVRVSDNPNNRIKDGRRQVFKSITISVLDVNDLAPVFTSSDFDTTILDGALPGSSVATVSATDGDEQGTVNSQIEYGLTAASGTVFVIDPSSGVITVGAVVIDSDRGPQQYLIHVTATDQGVPPLVADPDRDGSNALPVIITIQDINDNEPAFQNDSSAAWVGPVLIRESAGPGSIIATLAAADADANAQLHGSISYSIVAGPEASLFTLQVVSGAVTV